MTYSISERQHSIDAIVGCSYLFPAEIALEVQISVRKVSVTPVADKVWKPIYFTPGSAGLTSEESMPFTGRLINSKFEMKIPGGSADMAAELLKVCGRAIVLKLTFESGAIMVCGGKNRKLRLAAAAALGTQKGSVLSFEYKSKKDFMWMN